MRLVSNQRHSLIHGGLRSHRWGVILAGGDGTRLLPLTQRIAGDDRPKQFCSVIGRESLLHQTQSRISRLVQPRQTLFALTRTHERFYADQLAGVPSFRLLVQPCNRGTAPAILYSLMHVRELDPSGVVAYFPSDHYFADEKGFAAHLDVVFAAAAAEPESVVLFGITPDSPEIAYGWIEPGAPLMTELPRPVYRVNAFWEKPSLILASNLMQRSCLWNSFIMVGTVHAFLNLNRQRLPCLCESFESIRRSLFTATEREALHNLYSSIRSTSFSEEVLSFRPDGLAVLCGTNLGWSDLGEPNRVFSVLERKGMKTQRSLYPEYGKVPSSSA